MSLPEKILLATDLSARSDRALGRATMIAAREGSALTVVHVVDPTEGAPQAPVRQLAALARSHLAHDLGPCLEHASIRVEEGEPAEVIARVAREEGSTLIVAGVARVERFGRFVLGKTVERLVRGVETPLLIVAERPRAPYRRIAVAVDFSTVSCQTLALAAHLFPEQRLTVFHAYQPPIGGYGVGDIAHHRAQYREVADSNYRTWLDGTGLDAATRARLDVRLEYGEPARLIAEAAERGELDLVVLGTRGRGRIFEFFVGSVARRILDRLPCDALFVREQADLPPPGAPT